MRVFDKIPSTCTHQNTRVKHTDTRGFLLCFAVRAHHLCAQKAPHDHWTARRYIHTHKEIHVSLCDTSVGASPGPARRVTYTNRPHAHIHTYVYLLRPGARGRGHGGCRRAHGSHALSSLGEDDLAVGVRIALHLLLLVRRVLDGHLADDDHPFVELDLTALDDELLALEERG